MMEIPEVFLYDRSFCYFNGAVLRDELLLVIVNLCTVCSFLFFIFKIYSVFISVQCNSLEY